ncbi:PHP domain-containing protein [Arachidicoccus sp.]|uniref:PHP domain-containing protein n=1 Tax=Arachidicoccus sp. TaxID=1872624 RepID=UPI003D1BB0A2
MTNKSIAANFKLLGQLMEIYGDDSFKIKSYLNASRTIEKLPAELASLAEDKIFSIVGIGKAIGNKIIEQLQTETFKVLEQYIAKTPPGIIEMLHIKGLGPKKISTIWNDLEIETIGELLYACNENRLMLYKGFGEKTQNSISEAIDFYSASKGRFLFSEIENAAISFNDYLKRSFLDYTFLLTGAFHQNAITIDALEWVTDATEDVILEIIDTNNFELISKENEFYAFKTPTNITIYFIQNEKKNIYNKCFQLSCSENFYTAFASKFSEITTKNYSSDKAFFSENNVEFIPPYLREDAKWIDAAQKKSLPKIIEPEDIKGVIHSHSKWSDGANTLREMAEAAKQQGFEYLAISDHSQIAVYANGLSIEKITAQHKEIDELNQSLAPFKIFKSIESDILYNGDLDYADEILKSFDLVIASIHSNLKMGEEKAMERLMKAIENPFTNILGHMTGRLLLSRAGYPVNHKKIIEACAANNVVIELNANPRRLDIDWHWIDHALEKNVLISINPDAHSIRGIKDIRYGVLAAQKAGLTAKDNLSSFSLQELESFIQRQKEKHP